VADAIMRDMFKIGKFRIEVKYNVIDDTWRFGFIPTEEYEFQGDEGRRVYYMLWRMECLQNDIEGLYEEIEKAKKESDGRERISDH